MQLEINFSNSGGNRLRSALNCGEFVLLVESSIPERRGGDNFQDTERLAALEETVLKESGLFTGLAVTDCGEGKWRGVELAATLPEANRDRHLVYLSGAGTDRSEAEKLLSIAAGAGIRNLVMVSGDAPYKAGAAATANRTFTESTRLLELAASRNPAERPFFTGATTNPFQYSPWTMLAGFSKISGKFAAGAEMLVTQAGWDMLKLQSLIWHMNIEELYYPRLARLFLLSPMQMENILAGDLPGIFISGEFRKLLERELRYSKSQFEAAQYRRLALQAAGCRLFGFNGIQLAGAASPMRAAVAAERIRNALTEFSSFDAWLDEYNSYMGSADMAPVRDGYFRYDRILHRDYPADSVPTPNDKLPESSSWMERRIYSLRKFFFAAADRQRAGHGRIMKKLLCGCRSCDQCLLPLKNFQCVMRCPKKLRDGICGGVTPEGMCETGSFECVHSKALRLGRRREPAK